MRLGQPFPWRSGRLSFASSSLQSARTQGGDYGRGGIIITNDDEFAARLRRLRHQGMSLSDFERHRATATTFESYPEIGYNFRMTDIQAAIGLCQLDRLDEMLAARRRVAERYTSFLSDHTYVGPECAPPAV